jgi:hypothetical protein
MDKHTIRLQKAREYYYENKDKYKERYLENRKSSRPAASSGSESEAQGKQSSKKSEVTKTNFIHDIDFTILFDD